MANQYTDGWSDEDVRFLRNNVGVLTFDGIARKLKKTARAVESKLDKLGMANTKFASGFITMHELAQALYIDDKVVKRWIENKGLPYVQKNFRYGEYNERRGQEKKRLFYYINVDQFWKWAEEHREAVNWYQVPMDALLPEPLWVKEQRKADYKRKNERCSWTDELDDLLWKYYYQDGKTQKEIAELMGRTQNSIEKRLARLRKKKKEAAHVR